MDEDSVERLVRFLRARLVEDEEIATAARTGHQSGAEWWDSATLVEKMQITPTEAQHIATHGPLRVLAEVQAKRRLIEEAIDADQPGEYWHSESREWALRLLALPYAQHAEYQDAWRP